MKKIICFLSLIAFIGGCTAEHGRNENLKVITIDTWNGESPMDISDIFEDDIEVIKLETTKECLVSANDNKIINGTDIIISDRVSQKISLFDRNGKFVRNIGMVGRGAGEYSALGDFSVGGDSVYVQDAQQDKVVVYPTGGGRFREFEYNPPIYYKALIPYDDDLYFVTNYAGGYNLIGLDKRNNERKHLIPFDKKIEEKELAWGIEKHVGQYRDSVLLIYGRNDTVYSLAKDGVRPMYLTHFVRNTIPEDLSDKKNIEVYKAAIDEGYTLGLSKIVDTRDYVIGNFGEGVKNWDFFYDKSNGGIRLSDYFVFRKLGGLPMMSNYTSNDADEFVLTYDAVMFRTICEKILTDDFGNPENRKKIDAVYELLRDDENPVMIVLKFRNRPTPL